MPEQDQESFVKEHREDAGTHIHATIRVVIPVRKRKEVLMILRSIVEQTRHIEGCNGCRLYQDLQDERALMLQESWAGEKALRRHLRSEAFRHILLVVEMATEAPEIRFDWISRSTGIETIKDARAERKTLTGMIA